MFAVIIKHLLTEIGPNSCCKLLGAVGCGFMLQTVSRGTGLCLRELDTNPVVLVSAEEVVALSIQSRLKTF